MGEAEMGMGSTLKTTLKNLCCGYGWSYGVFWRFDQNSLLLTLEDSYYEEQFGSMVGSMFPQVHPLGEGVIGGVALTGKHQWMFSDPETEKWNPTGAIGCKRVLEDSEFHHQISSGIKTIAVISVKTHGVAQFGSVEKIPQRMEFLDQTHRLLTEMEMLGDLNPMENTPSFFGSGTEDVDGFFNSLISSCDGTPKSIFDDISGEIMGNVCSSSYHNDASPSIYWISEGGMTPLHGESYGLDCHFSAAPEAEVLYYDKPSTSHVFSESTYSESNYTVDNPSPFETWNDDLFLPSLEQLFASGIEVQDFLDECPSKADTFFCQEDIEQSVHEDSMLGTLYNTGGVYDREKAFEDITGNLMGQQHSNQSSILTDFHFAESVTGLNGFSEEVDFSGDISKLCSMDDISQLFDPSPENSNNDVVAASDAHPSQSMAVTSRSSLVESDTDILRSTLAKHPSVHNSVLTTNSNKQATSSVMHNYVYDILDVFGVDFRCDQNGECLQDIVESAATETCVSECITEADTGSLAGPRKGLFSELGINQLLDDMSSSTSLNKTSFEYHSLTNKRQRTESSVLNCNPMQSSSLACYGATMNVSQPFSNLAKTNNLIEKRHVLPKSQVGLWIGDSYSINTKRDVAAQPQRSEVPPKPPRKKARPGESTRPRPKDRQQIQDRIKELRGIIPNGGKYSIDSLLDHTIKYMLFLQSVTAYADKIRHTNEPKLIDQPKGPVLSGSNRGGGGVTWAFEVDGQSTICPIVVEDLNQPGQMLIEMLCEKQGSFLEIADIIRGLGLNILKGKMETREDKIWGRYIVEANRNVKRLDIFWSLVRLLLPTNTSRVDSTDKPSNVIDPAIPSTDNPQKPAGLDPTTISMHGCSASELKSFSIHD